MLRRKERTAARLAVRALSRGGVAAAAVRCKNTLPLSAQPPSRCHASRRCCRRAVESARLQLDHSLASILANRTCWGRTGYRCEGNTSR